MLPKKVIHVIPENAPVQGEIGEFITGLLGSTVYHQAVKRSILIGPMAGGHDTMLEWIHRNGEILYSAHTDEVRHPYGKALREVERKFGVAILYAHRSLPGAPGEKKSLSEILLIDASHADLLAVNALKAWLYEEFGIESLRYEKMASGGDESVSRSLHWQRGGRSNHGITGCVAVRFDSWHQNHRQSGR